MPLIRTTTTTMVAAMDLPPCYATVLNEVVLAYNSFGQLVSEHQEHDGAKDAYASPARSPSSSVAISSSWSTSLAGTRY